MSLRRLAAATRRARSARRCATAGSVRFLRIAIPATVAVAVLAGVVATSWLQPLRALAKVPIELGSLVVSGTKITMQQPRLAGFTADNRQYELTAQAAAQDLTKPGMVELQGLRAIMEMQDKISYEHTGEDRRLQQPHRDAHPAAQHRGDVLGRLPGAAQRGGGRYQERQDRLGEIRSR